MDFVTRNDSFPVVRPGFISRSRAALRGSGGTAPSLPRRVSSLRTIALALWWSGCGAAVAPQELHNARHAYTQASQGPAAQLAPAQLDTARQGLERANMAFGSGADEVVVR